jgi:phosphoglycerate dehydrogenase-like enzyme
MPRPALEALERLRRRGLLRVEVRPVVIGPQGTVEDGEVEGVKVLWRTGRVGRTWLHGALERLPDLRLLHSDFVGVEGVPLEELAKRGVVVTNGTGNYSRPMAEWVVLALLAAAKRFPDFVRRSDARVWDPSPVLRELEGSVALLLGLGSVNSLVATMLAPFRVEARAIVRTPRPAPPPGVARVATRERLLEELREADFVVVGVPLTNETAGMLDAAAFSAVKPGAWLVNVARGAVVDEAALLAALDDGRLGGAVLDAFVKEPLPPDHPLWGRPNVVVLPHHTWSSPQSFERMGELFADQLARFVEGRPLRNVVPPERGY